jgi:hypothetical protein
LKGEKKSPKKKNASTEDIEEKTERVKRILEETIELPSHIAIMRGLCKIKKYRHSSPKRKR